MPRDGGEWRNRTAFNEMSARALAQQLTTVRFRGPLTKDDIPLICTLRNEAARLPLFFEHYKNLGVTRFFITDNDSTDESLNILLDEPAADVFISKVPFQESKGGVYWSNGLAHAHCLNRWMLRVDADELLVYDGMDDHPLPHLTRLLDTRDLDRLYAPMIDLYSSAGFNSDDRPLAEIIENDSWFDDDGYKLDRWREGWHLTGGPRERLFHNKPETKYGHWLSKYPLLRMEESKTFFNQHYFWPFDKVTRGPMAALLHLKLTDNFRERCARYVQEKQHANESKGYRIINNELQKSSIRTAMHSRSKRYRGPKSFIRHNLMFSIDWNKLKFKEPHAT